VTSGGFVTIINVTFGGGGYVIAPPVTISGGGGSGATATASISGGVVTGITVNNPGSGYTGSPIVTVAPPPENLLYTTYWSNDGTSAAGSEPGAAVSVPVNNGLFTARLGDAALANMTAFPAGLFLQPDLKLRVWFNDGVSGFAVLNPAQPLTATPYAFVAGSVSNLSGIYSGAVTFNNPANSYSGSGTALTGINATLLDGLDSVQFLRGDVSDTISGSLTINSGGGTDAVLSETGIDRASGSAQTFAITNTGAGGMSLAVENEVRVGNGTNTAPSFSFASDPDTGLYRPLANNVALVTGGTERLRVGANGDVGIGTTNAQQHRLHVVDAPSGISTFFSRAAVIENNGDVTLALRSSISNSSLGHDIIFERPIGATGARIHLDDDAVLEFGRFRFTSESGASTASFLLLDLSTGNLGLQRTPATNDLEVANNASKAAAGDWLANSDRRIKTNIRDVAHAQETLMKLRPVVFRYTAQWRERNPALEDRDYHNFIAQEYQQVFPHAVQGSGEYLEGDPQEILQMDTHDAQMITIKAVQELIQENVERKAENAELKRELKDLKRILNNLANTKGQP
jgi:hypothetical protein